MAHFAELNASNEVINVLVVSNEDAPTEDTPVGDTPTEEPPVEGTPEDEAAV